MNSARIMMLSIVTIALAGCMPHLSQEQCKAMNWNQMGFGDGSEGKMQRSLQRDIQDCAKFKVAVDQAGYQRGWKAGVRDFCSKTGTAYDMGANGKNYNHICPSDLAAKFDSSWKRGLRKYCIPSTGYNLGRSGAAMPSFCSADQVGAFRNAYNSGHRVFAAILRTKVELETINRDIKDTQNRINRLRDDIAHQQSILSNLALWPQHSAARQQIRNDNNAIYDLQDHLDRATRHRNQVEKTLARQESQD